MTGSGKYQVRARIREELSGAWWSGVFAGLVVEPQPDGTTLVSGEVTDQAALHGLVEAIRDLGLTVVSIDGKAVPIERPPLRSSNTGGV